MTIRSLNTDTTKVGKTAEWCNRFDIVPNANGTIHLYIHLMCLNQVLIRLMHRGITIYDILTKYMTYTDASYGYNILKCIKDHHM